MRLGRRLWLLMAIALGSIGCRAAGTGSLSLNSRPMPIQEPLVDLDQFVADHNRNAAMIQSLEASPAIKVAMPRRPQFPLEGRMALDRPRNFRLELFSHKDSKADIGSNAEEFWFWVSNTEDRSIYWCNYADLESSPLAVTYQPDWIIEALGLRPISPEEKAEIKPRKGPEPGTTTLVFAPTRNRTESYTRWMTVSNRDRRIKQLQIYTATTPPVLIAQATPSDYKPFASQSDRTATAKGDCYLPEKLVLDWKRDQVMKMEVVLLDVHLNEFDPSRKEALFTEPEIEGYKRRNLAELNRGARQQGQRTITRQTIPSPASRNAVELGRPAPLSDDDGPVVPKLGLTNPPATRSVASSMPIPPPQTLVGSPLPTPPEPPALQSARNEQYPPLGGGFSIER